MYQAAVAAPWSAIGRQIGEDIKSGLRAVLNGLPFTVSVNVNGRVQGLNGYVNASFAGGGYPETGTLFYAGEAGAEAVGTIGGRTGVANRDQIASAIAIALKPMLGNGNGNGTQTTNVNVKLDSATIAKASMKGRQAMNRQFNITANA